MSKKKKKHGGPGSALGSGTTPYKLVNGKKVYAVKKKSSSGQGYSYVYPKKKR